MNRSETTNPKITALSFKDRDAVINIWSESFYNYPTIRECFLAYAEDEQQYKVALPYLFGFFFDLHFYQNTYLLGIRCDGELASPVIIGPVPMLGFLDIGGTYEGQEIYRRTNNSDFTRG